ncbi:hypothetical protein F5Y00DRAFT_261053 [Daldinia vernicosa]|uniref:uncharacterized protein n=1 Tax=Daldinia vernicosa TaxID=114800 RepID=UPI002008D1CA|nr:uncharacterized protein F5Y00DRAFT_261053 [Daldinia vernicosa]KAI0849946.1 hypothetical protein F5Y00DRAFT_261053 [Daldinia vernicosa]
MSSGLPRTLSSSSPTTMSPDTPATTPTVASSKSHPATPSASPTTMPPPECQNATGNDSKKRKRDRKDESNEDLQVEKKPKRASKSSQPKPQSAEVNKPKRGQGDDATKNIRVTRSMASNKNVESEAGVAPRNKRQRDQEVDTAENARLAKKQKLTIEKLERQLKEANDELLSARLDLTSTKDKLRRETEEVGLLEGQLRRATFQFFTEVQLYSLTCRFEMLCYEVGSFVGDNLVKVFEGDTIPEHIEKRLKEVSETPLHKFLKSRSYARLLFEAFIWNFLCTEYFENPFKLWGKGDEVGAILGAILAGKFGGKAGRLNMWKAHTAQILQDCPIDAAKLEGPKEQLLGLLEMFIVEEKKSKIKDEVEPGMNKIFELATSIARDLNRFDDRVEIMRKRHPDARVASQSYDDDWMVISNPSIENGDAVELIITPALVKYNRYWDSDEEHFYAVKKAQILYKNGVWFVDSDEYKRMKAERVRGDTEK